MLAKSLLIGSFLALLTVGVVYFGIGEAAEPKAIYKPATLDGVNAATSSQSQSAVIDIETLNTETETDTVTSLESYANDRDVVSIIQTHLKANDFNAAKNLVPTIQSANMRDTARSNIAMALADKGNQAAALAVVDDVENDSLANVIRMQIIQSLPGSE